MLDRIRQNSHSVAEPIGLIVDDRMVLTSDFVYYCGGIAGKAFSKRSVL